MNILQFMNTPELMGDIFQGETWKPWRAVLSGAFGLPMDDDQAALFDALSGGRSAPTSRVRELWVVAGRRSAKTQTAGAVAVYLATVGAALDGLASKLSPGEKGVIALLAVDRQQAKVALGYIRGVVEGSPVLAGMVEKQNTDGIEFNNRVAIEVHTNSFRSVRGRTLLAVLFDEVAFFRSDNSASPDIETYRAAVPGLATTGGLVFGFSSPYAKRGLLHDKYRKHFGKDGDVLVVQGATTDFNPTIDKRIIQDALDDDYEAAQAEWLGRFRSDVEAFLQRDTIEGLMRPSPLVIPYDSKYRYSAFVDPAGGGADEFTLAIGHLEGDVVVVDAVRAERGTPAEIVAEYAELLRSYRVYEVSGDRYGGSWPADEFRRNHIDYKTSEKPKSGLYQDALPLFNSGRVELPPCNRLLNQLTGLERRTSRSGRDSIDHPPGGHDDRANAVAGLITNAAKAADYPTNVQFKWIR